jgi:hypothetical protein
LVNGKYYDPSCGGNPVTAQAPSGYMSWDVWHLVGPNFQGSGLVEGREIDERTKNIDFNGNGQIDPMPVPCWIVSFDKWTYDPDILPILAYPE